MPLVVDDQELEYRPFQTPAQQSGPPGVSSPEIARDVGRYFTAFLAEDRGRSPVQMKNHGGDCDQDVEGEGQGWITAPAGPVWVCRGGGEGLGRRR